MKVTVSKVDNRYTVEAGYTRMLVFHTLDEALQEMLAYFENRYPCASGDAHGEVKVLR